MIYDCIIIGAGASGLFCGASMETPLKGLILEKTASPGTKLLMSGSGQCNITHSGSIKEFINCYGSNGNKIRNCLYKYNNLSLMEFLEENGVPTVTRSDGKVFPVSMDAHDILDLLIKKSRKNGFEIKENENVTGISHLSLSPESRNTQDYPNESDCENSGDRSSLKTSTIWQIQTQSTSYRAHTVVFAAGGCSYPKTGSDGSIFPVLKKDLGMDILPLKPALASLRVTEYPYSELSGISFENAQIMIIKNKQNASEDNSKVKNKDDSYRLHGNGKKSKGPIRNIGPVLLTHKDFSGPAVLNISKFADAGDILKINYLYPLNQEQIFKTLKDATHGSKSDLANIITDTFSLPKRFSQSLIKRCGNSLKVLTSHLAGEEFVIASSSGFNTAIATSGGVNLSQINLTTMESKQHTGVFFIGEMLDIDGITGGYNLQFAYSSAKAAAAKICPLK